MKNSDTITLKITGDQNIIKELCDEISNDKQNIEIKSYTQIHDKTIFRFGLMEAAAIAAIIQTTFYATELAVKIFNTLSKQKNRNHHIIIQTIYKKTDILFSEDTTVRDIQEQLNSIES